MGLDLIVGIRAFLEGPEAAAAFAADLAPINEALALADLPRDEEPSAEPGDVFPPRTLHRGHR
jgi:hypothetical protein